MDKKAANSRDDEETEENPKIYITHYGGHRVDPKELFRNKRVRELIRQMARIGVSESRRRWRNRRQNNGVQRPD